jgi:hypothetical protein
MRACARCMHESKMTKMLIYARAPDGSGCPSSCAMYHSEVARGFDLGACT